MTVINGTHRNLVLSEATPPWDGTSLSPQIGTNGDVPGEELNNDILGNDGDELGIGTGRRSGDRAGEEGLTGLAPRGGGGGGLFEPVLRSDEDDAERNWPY